MAGVGAAPKDVSQRHRGKAPRRGEWVDLPLVVGKVPPLPKGEWSMRTKRCWRSWWIDPVASQWTPADREAVLELAYIHAELVAGRFAAAAEVRLRMDLLGLTQKGKRDLRWRVAVQPAAVVKGGNVTAIDRYKAMVE